MAATFTLTATPEPAATPPRVRLDVTETGTPVISSITINRTDVDGAIRTVRTTDGAPLPVSGGAALVYDTEIPYGTSVTYQIVEGNSPTATTTLDVADPWLTHLGVPSKSMPIDLRIGANDEEEWAIDQGVFPILGRAEPIVITGTSRTASSSTLIVGVDSLTERKALADLLSDGSPLLLNVSPALGLGIDTDYIAVGAVRSKRRTNIGTDPFWDLTMPYQVVARPAGGTRAPYIWADESAKYALWSSIPKGTTWAQVAAGA